MKKYGIDTNVLIRYIVQDDPKQSEKATRFLEKNCTIDNPGHIAGIVLSEIVWVLKRAYGFPKTDIVNVLQSILSTAEFSIDSPAIAWEAFRQYKTGSADFSDYLLGQLNKASGCMTTITFDREAGKNGHFQLL